MSVMNHSYDNVFGKSQSDINLGYKSWLWVRDCEINDKLRISTKSLIEHAADPYIKLDCVYNTKYRIALRTTVENESNFNIGEKNDSLM